MKQLSSSFISSAGPLHSLLWIYLLLTTPLLPFPLLSSYFLSSPPVSSPLLLFPIPSPLLLPNFLCYPVLPLLYFFLFNISSSPFLSTPLLHPCPLFSPLSPLLYILVSSPPLLFSFLSLSLLLFFPCHLSPPLLSPLVSPPLSLTVSSLVLPSILVSSSPPSPTSCFRSCSLSNISSSHLYH